MSKHPSAHHRVCHILKLQMRTPPTPQLLHVHVVTESSMFVSFFF